jgi:hypothetical protein
VGRSCEAEVRRQQRLEDEGISGHTDLGLSVQGLQKEVGALQEGSSLSTGASSKLPAFPAQFSNKAFWLEVTRMGLCSLQPAGPYCKVWTTVDSLHGKMLGFPRRSHPDNPGRESITSSPPSSS